MSETLGPSTVIFETTNGLHLTGSVLGIAGRPAVILLHGGGQTRHSWRGTMERLAAAGYQALAYDARGHGDSDWDPAGQYHPIAQSEDLLTVRATIAGPVALVGASMGGMTACRAIGSSQEQVANALVLVDIVPCPALTGTSRIARFMKNGVAGFDTLQDAVEAVADYNPSRRRSVDPASLKRNLRSKADGRLYWHWDPRLLGPSTPQQLSETSSMVMEVIDCVRIPTLLVRGAHSDVVDDEGVTHMRRAIPQTEVLQVDGAGHMIVGEKNDAFADGILDFLQKHLSVPGS